MAREPKIIGRSAPNVGVLPMAGLDLAAEGRRRRRKQIKWTLIIVFGTPVVLIVGFVGLMLGGILWSQHQLDSVPRSPANYQPAAQDMIKMCQSDPAFFGEDATRDQDSFNPAWAPPSILKLHIEDMQVSPDCCKLWWGGGFYHCGLQLDLVPGSQVGQNQTWTLTFTREGKPVQVLQTITAPTSQKYTETEFVKQVTAELDRRLAAHEDDGSTMEATWYPAAARCLFLQKFHRIDLLQQSIRTAAANDPHDWRDVLLAYLVGDHTNGMTPSAHLTTWANQTGGQTAWMYAAYAFYQGSDTTAGDAAVKHAMLIPSSDPDWMDKEQPEYELGMAVRLYNAGAYQQSANFCKAILALPHRYFVTRNAVTQLMNWAAGIGRPTSLPDYDKFTSLDPFGGFDLNLLLQNTPNTTAAGAANARPTAGGEQ